jgi:hypothetical protein
MFAKRARLRKFNRDSQLESRRSPVAARPCNDNQPLGFNVPARRMRRPMLFCRWHRTPAGALECRWQTEPVAVSAVEEPGISWLIARAEASAIRCGIAVAAA